MPITSADQRSVTRRGLMGGLLCAPLIIRTAHANATKVPMRLNCKFADQEFTVVLNDSPSARDLVSLLPLELSIEDYATNEKIAYLPRKLSEVGTSAFSDEAVGDVCTYAPWGNLVFFHGSYRYVRGLIRLARVEGAITPLLTRGTFPLSLTLIG